MSSSELLFSDTGVSVVFERVASARLVLKFVRSILESVGTVLGFLSSVLGFATGEVICELKTGTRGKKSVTLVSLYFISAMPFLSISGAV